MIFYTGLIYLIFANNLAKNLVGKLDKLNFVISQFQPRICSFLSAIPVKSEDLAERGRYELNCLNLLRNRYFLCVVVQSYLFKSSWYFIYFSSSSVNIALLYSSSTFWRRVSFSGSFSNSLIALTYSG